MVSNVFPSPKLSSFPERILVISDKNFANVCYKLGESLKSGGMDARYLNGRTMDMSNPAVIEAFKGDHKKCLAVFYDPGSLSRNDHPRNQFTSGISIPDDMPWCLYRGSSYYRVTNLQLESQPVSNKRMITKPKTMTPHSSKISFSEMREINKYFDSLTPLVMVGTEDLLSINPKCIFLGQPQVFPQFTEKKPSSIGHISSPLATRNIRKGTDIILTAFKGIGFMATSVIGIKKLPYEECMKYLSHQGMFVSTITNWDYGLGYTGLESISHGCLTMAKNSMNADKIGSKVVNVSNASDIIAKAKYYHDNPSEYEAKRKEQYDWAEENFSYDAVSKRFKSIVQTYIDKGW